MKTLFNALIYLLFSFALYCQSKVEIHQIDVGTGDAALINIMKNDGTGVQYSILIDGGEQRAQGEVQEYIRNYARKIDMTYLLDYVCVSHYHEDHIGGLVGVSTDGYAEETAEGDKTLGKRVRCDNYYNGVLSEKSDIRYFAVLDRGTESPLTHSKVYEEYVKMAGTRRVSVGATTLGTPGVVEFIQPSGDDLPFPTPINQNLALGGYIDLGTDVNGTQVRLRLILTDARVYYPQQPNNAVDVAANYDPMRKIYDEDDNIINLTTRQVKENENNWGLGWVLEYGAFRWYTAGDVGGTDGSDCGAYFDIETTIANASQVIYPMPKDNTNSGHICTQKVSHHGSQCSSNQYFLNVLRPSSAVISGPASKHDHPKQEVLDRLQTTAWPQTDSLFFNSIAYYFLTGLPKNNVNISLWKGRTSGNVFWVATEEVLTEAQIEETNLMINGSNLYTIRKPQQENGLYEHNQGDVIIKVTPETDNIPIRQRSIYTVKYASCINGRPDLETIINCHGE